MLALPPVQLAARAPRDFQDSGGSQCRKKNAAATAPPITPANPAVIKTTAGRPNPRRLRTSTPKSSHTKHAGKSHVEKIP